MYMYTYMHICNICIHIYIYMHIDAYTYTYIYIYVQTQTHASTHVGMFVHAVARREQQVAGVVRRERMHGEDLETPRRRMGQRSRGTLPICSV